MFDEREYRWLILENENYGKKNNWQRINRLVERWEYALERARFDKRYSWTKKER